MKNGIPLIKYLERSGMTQAKLAALLGTHQSRIQGLVARESEVYIYTHRGKVTATELLPVPRRKAG